MWRTVPDTVVEIKDCYNVLASAIVHTHCLNYKLHFVSPEWAYNALILNSLVQFSVLCFIDCLLNFKPLITVFVNDLNFQSLSKQPRFLTQSTLFFEICVHWYWIVASICIPIIDCICHEYSGLKSVCSLKILALDLQILSPCPHSHHCILHICIIDAACPSSKSIPGQISLYFHFGFLIRNEMPKMSKNICNGVLLSHKKECI